MQENEEANLASFEENEVAAMGKGETEAKEEE